jgi:hypothetical protein
MNCEHNVNDWSICMDCLPSDDDEFEVSTLYCPSCGQTMATDRVRAAYASTSRAPFPSPCRRCLQGAERRMKMSSGAKSLLRRILG